MKNARHLFILTLLLGISLAACGGVPTPAPSAEDSLNQLATMVAATVEAAQNAEAQPAPATAEATAPTAEVAPAPVAPANYPDFPGLRVAFVKNGDIYVWTEGGTLLGITGTGDVSEVKISDDGQYVAYMRETAPFVQELWVINSDSAELTPTILVGQDEMNVLKAASQFPDAEGLGFDQIEWRPGTHELYYSTVPRFSGPGYVPMYDIRVANVDTGTKTTLFDFGQAGKFYFAPDGSQLALVTPENISLVNADGNNFRPNILSYQNVITYSEYQYHPVPIWAIDAASLRVTIPPADPLAESPPPSSLWFLPIDGTPATQLGSIPAVPFDWPDYAFSPDMSYVAYVKAVGDPVDNQRELHIAYADGSNDYTFAAGVGLGFRGWSPDSTRFVYAANGTDDQSLYRGSIIEGVPFTITSVNQTVRQLNWVDNSRFIYISDINGVVELRISDQDGTNHAFIDTLTDPFPSFDFTP